MLQGGRLGGGFAGAGGALGAAGSALLLLPAFATLAAALWGAGALALAVAVWMILVEDERPPVRVGGWVAIAGFVAMAAAAGVAMSGSAAPGLLFPVAALAVVAGLGAAGYALAKAEPTRTAGGWVLVSALALLVGLVLAVDPVAEIALAASFASWVAIGFLATRPAA